MGWILSGRWKRNRANSMRQPYEIRSDSACADPDADSISLLTGTLALLLGAILDVLWLMMGLWELIRLSLTI